MNRIVICGASGDLGRRVTKLLLKEASGIELTLVTRTPEKLADLAAEGIRVLRGDYQNPDSLDAAYSGADTLFLISGLNLGRRVPEHRQRAHPGGACAADRPMGAAFRMDTGGLSASP